MRIKPIACGASHANMSEEDWGWNGADAVSTARADARDDAGARALPKWFHDSAMTDAVEMFPLAGALGEEMAVAMAASRLAAVIGKASGRQEFVLAMCIDFVRLDSLAARLYCAPS